VVYLSANVRSFDGDLSGDIDTSPSFPLECTPSDPVADAVSAAAAAGIAKAKKMSKYY